MKYFYQVSLSKSLSHLLLGNKYFLLFKKKQNSLVENIGEMLNIVALSWRCMKHDNTVKTLRSPLKENFLTLFSPDCSILGE